MKAKAIKKYVCVYMWSALKGTSNLGQTGWVGREIGILGKEEDVVSFCRVKSCPS